MNINLPESGSLEEVVVTSGINKEKKKKGKCYSNNG
jgi:hypothetical protein